MTVASAAGGQLAQVAGERPPFVVGVGFLALGAVLLVLWRLGGHERFFSRRPFELADPDVVAGRVLVGERTGLDDPALVEAREDAP